ncbi:hypothetical protein [Methylotenera sp. G11]|uniref:hypothetical protein n=1 Tax=Methylotenera sp. G11 TaxID=1506585 RepID=UPI0006488BDD|nr:hypothetical protein [Methylotenera sp. G11]
MKQKLRNKNKRIDSTGSRTQKVIKWLNTNSEPYAHWATVLALIAAIIGGYVAYAQLKLANEQRRWQNYNEMNVRYAELYKNIPIDIASGCFAENFENLPSETKRWVRQYFNLYSEEYWLYLNKLIPDEMWTKRIHGGVRVNLGQYPALVAGYRYWRDRGSFTHPNSFQAEVESAIVDSKHFLKKTKQDALCVSSKVLKIKFK